MTSSSSAYQFTHITVFLLLSCFGSPLISQWILVGTGRVLKQCVEIAGVFSLRQYNTVQLLNTKQVEHFTHADLQMKTGIMRIGIIQRLM